MHSHKILRIASIDAALQNKLSGKLGISKVLAQLLINRGIKTLAEAQEFLNTKLDNLLDPYSFSDMHKAVSLIRNAHRKKEKVMIFGDYDVDGITALLLLEGTLKKMGLDVTHYLPHRIKDGYGLSKDVLGIIKNKDAKLLITVDCGISNHREIEELRRHNIEVIITDHHESVSHNLPPASSIINPKVKGSGYKYRDLAGVGVAYKLCQAASGSGMAEDMDLVSLGTIADVAPLTGENRIIAKEGLDKLSKTSRPGLKALIENAGLKDRKFTTTFVSFILGPRINASGRMDTAETSLELLMSETEQGAEGLAKIVEAHNRQRQKVEKKILEEAGDLINKEVNFKEHQVIVIAKEDWHEGVLGIVASKIADRFYRPAIVISLREKLCKGSGRSIKNFHLFQALFECKEFLEGFGGHAHAAGLVIAKKNIDDFKRSINRFAKEKLALEDLLPSLDIDMEVGLSDLSQEIIEELEALEPFGSGNPEPLFYARSLRLKGEPQILSAKTLKCWVTDGNVTYQAIGFAMANFKQDLMKADYFDLVYSPRIDFWRDERTVLLEIKEIFFS